MYLINFRPGDKVEIYLDFAVDQIGWRGGDAPDL